MYPSIGVGWSPVGTEVQYYANEVSQAASALGVGDRQSAEAGSGPRFTLEWKYVFEFAEDEVFFAQFPPYMYSDLLHDLDHLKQRNAGEGILRTNILCKTPAQNSCPMVTITENVDTYLSYSSECVLAGKSTTAKRQLLGQVEQLRARLQVTAPENSQKVRKASKLRQDTINASHAASTSNRQLIGTLNDKRFLECGLDCTEPFFTP
jgi:hypothetical protein